MASSKAKKEAKSTLGSFDDSAYETQRSSAKSMYDTQLADAGNQWTNLQNRLTSSRKASATDFAKGRSNVAETNYLANRADLNRRAAGGTTASGFSDISNLGNRMELGRQYSNLANTYYNALEGIDRDQTEGQQAYDMALRQAKDSYDMALANIGLAQQGAQNQYNAQLASLAEGIQSRWDANANAAAALQAQKEANNKSLALQRAQYIDGIIGGLNGESNDLDILNTYEKLKYLGLSDKEIQKMLRQQTGLNNLDFKVNEKGNVALFRTTPTVKDYINPTSGTTPISYDTLRSNAINKTLPSSQLSPYQELFYESNPYFNKK